MRHRRAGAALVLTVAVGTLMGGCANSASGPQADGTTPRPGRTTTAVEKTGSVEHRAGELPGVGAASCVEEYTPQAVTGRAFAFDGTVTDIADEQTDLGYVAVTFAVNEWFHGSNAGTLAVEMAPPETTTFETAVSGGSYEVGSRLLVSGEPRWGGDALNDAVAWGCGFTRYYDEPTAASWRNVGG